MAEIRIPTFAHLAVAATCLACACPNAAGAAPDVPGGSNTQAKLAVTNKATTGDWAAVNDSDWYRVELRKGARLAAYLDEAGDGALFTLTLRDAKGKALKSSTGDVDAPAGFEHAVAKSGLYYLESVLKAEDSFNALNGAYRISIGSDCAGTLRTHCVLKLNKPQERAITFYGDVDVFKLQVVENRTYQITTDNKLDGITDFEIKLLDGKAKALATSAPADDPTLSFKAAYTGTAYVKAASGNGEGRGDYTIEVR